MSATVKAIAAAGAAGRAHPMILLADELIRLNARLRSVFGGVTASTGLTPMELSVLTAATEARTPPTVAQIGRSLGHPRQVVQRAANALAEAGLIETAANPNHKRAPVLRATAEGQALKTEADARAVQAGDAVLADLDAAQCQRLADELHELRAGIEAHLRARSV